MRRQLKDCDQQFRAAIVSSIVAETLLHKKCLVPTNSRIVSQQQLESNEILRLTMEVEYRSYMRAWRGRDGYHLKAHMTFSWT